MNSFNIKLTYDYVTNLVDLTWNDIIFGIKYGFLYDDAAIEHAVRCVEENPSSSKAVWDLAKEIDAQDHDDSKNKFLFLLLNWVYEHQADYQEPHLNGYPTVLYAVETIYDDFGFPESIRHLIYYMPQPKSSFFAKKKDKPNLYERWKEYLDKERANYKLQS